MSRTSDPDRERVPRAMIHRRILDVAEAESDASIEAIADEVSGASMGLVERVLDEYGDPAGAPTDGASPGGTPASTGETGSDTGASTGPAADRPGDADDARADETEDTDDARADEPESGRTEPRESTMSQNGTESSATTGDDAGETPPEPGDLSEKQLRTARAVYENPEAPQEQIANALGVTRATVSRRLNDVPGFEWHERGAFVESLFEGDDAAEIDSGTAAGADGDAAADGTGTVDGTGTADGSTPPDGTPGGEGDTGLVAEGGSVAATEARVSDPERGDAGAGGAIPPELAHKVVHACMESDRISEDEELELLRSLMSG